MIIGRFRVRCRSDCSEEAAAAIAAVEPPSRELPGVVHFDVARSLTDPDVFIAVEVYETREDLDRQNSQQVVARMLHVLGDGVLVGDIEWTVWDGSPVP